MFSWIDRNRTAVWGHSYGGYATAMILEKDTENVFKCGISGAPVTSYIYYGNVPLILLIPLCFVVIHEIDNFKQTRFTPNVTWVYQRRTTTWRTTRKAAL